MPLLRRLLGFRGGSDVDLDILCAPEDAVVVRAFSHVNVDDVGICQHVRTRILGNEVSGKRAVLQIEPDLRAIGNDVGVDGEGSSDGGLRSGRGLPGDAVGGRDKVAELHQIVRALQIRLRRAGDGVIRFGGGRLLLRVLRRGRFFRRLKRCFRGRLFDGFYNRFIRKRRENRDAFGFFSGSFRLRLRSFDGLRQGNGLGFRLGVGKKLTDYDTETIGYRLWIVSDILSDSVLEYHLQTGHYDALGVKGYIENAERAKANADAVRAQEERLHHDQKAG